MPFESMGMNILLAAGVVLGGLALRWLIFYASWALADLPDQSPVKSWAAVTPTWLVVLAVVGTADWLFFGRHPDAGFGAARILTAIAGVVLTACLAGPCYVAFLDT